MQEILEKINKFLEGSISDREVCDWFWKEVWVECRENKLDSETTFLANKIFWIFEAYSPDFPNVKNNQLFEINKQKFKNELEKIYLEFNLRI